MQKERENVRRAAFAVLAGLMVAGLSACGSQADQKDQASEGGGLENAEVGAAAPSAPSTPAIDPNGLNAAEQETIKRGLLEILKSRTYGVATIRGRFSCSQNFGYGEPEITDASLSGQTGMVQLVVPVTAIAVHHPPNVLPPTYYPGRDCFGIQDTTEWSGESGQPLPLRFEVVVQRWQTGWRLVRNQNPPALL